MNTLYLIKTPMALIDLLLAGPIQSFFYSGWGNFGVLDLFLGLPLLYGLYKGLKNGLIIEIASIIALIAGIYGVMHFSYIASDYLSERLSWDARSIKLAAFAITFLAIVMAVHVLARFLTRIVKIALMGFLNTLAGGIFGVFKVAIILGALLIFFERANNTIGIVESETLQASFLYSPLRDLGSIVFDKILEPGLSLPQ
jgi:membrane protein required for colicin V production